MPSVSQPEKQDTTPPLDELRACAVKLEALETLPKPYDLYFAVKNPGAGTGWTYSCAGIGVTGIRAAADMLDSQGALIEQLYAKLTCCCGGYVADHGMGDGHSPVSMYDYALRNAEERTNDLKAALGMAIDVFAGMNDDEIDEELLPSLRKVFEGAK